MDRKGKSDDADKHNQALKDKTFVVKIKYNQNNSIQGSIQWVEKGKVVHFRSMMELLLLLSESVDLRDIRSWDGDAGAMVLINRQSE